MARPVIVWTNSAALLRKIDDALAELSPPKPTFGRGSPEQNRGFEVRASTGPRDLPARAAFVVTTGSSRTAERFATSLGAMPLTLPEGAEYLLRKCREAEPGDPIVLCGYDLRPSARSSSKPGKR